MNAHHSNAPRDPRGDAPVIGLDLSRSTRAIDRELRALYPHVAGFWWELDEGDRSGWVYRPDSRLVARLVHAAPRGRP